VLTPVKVSEVSARHDGGSAIMAKHESQYGLCKTLTAQVIFTNLSGRKDVIILSMMPVVHSFFDSRFEHTTTGTHKYRYNKNKQPSAQLCW